MPKASFKLKNTKLLSFVPAESDAMALGVVQQLVVAAVDRHVAERADDVHRLRHGSAHLRGKYRVTIQAVPNLSLTSEKKFCFNLRSLY